MSTAYQQLLTPETVTTLSNILDSCNIALSDILPADRIANDLMMGMKDLDRKDRELIKDWIYEGDRKSVV